jgi:hypothetical protein
LQHGHNARRVALQQIYQLLAGNEADRWRIAIDERPNVIANRIPGDWIVLQN